ncbi:MAG: hypothetical protein Q7S31_02115, partial [bacterium]|nr:hypothetical protein [bacterium]
MEHNISSIEGGPTEPLAKKLDFAGRVKTVTRTVQMVEMSDHVAERASKNLPTPPWWDEVGFNGFNQQINSLKLKSTGEGHLTSAEKFQLDAYNQVYEHRPQGLVKAVVDLTQDMRNMGVDYDRIGEMISNSTAQAAEMNKLTSQMRARIDSGDETALKDPRFTPAREYQVKLNVARGTEEKKRSPAENLAVEINDSPQVLATLTTAVKPATEKHPRVKAVETQPKATPASQPEKIRPKSKSHKHEPATPRGEKQVIPTAPVVEPNVVTMERWAEAGSWANPEEAKPNVVDAAAWSRIVGGEVVYSPKPTDQKEDKQNSKTDEGKINRNTQGASAGKLPGTPQPDEPMMSAAQLDEKSKPSPSNGHLGEKVVAGAAAAAAV